MASIWVGILEFHTAQVYLLTFSKTLALATMLSSCENELLQTVRTHSKGHRKSRQFLKGEHFWQISPTSSTVDWFCFRVPKNCKSSERMICILLFCGLSTKTVASSRPGLVKSISTWLLLAMIMNSATTRTEFAWKTHFRKVANIPRDAK